MILYIRQQTFTIKLIRPRINITAPAIIHMGFALGEEPDTVGEHWAANDIPAVRARRCLVGNHVPTFLTFNQCHRLPIVAFVVNHKVPIQRPRGIRSWGRRAPCRAGASRTRCTPLRQRFSVCLPLRSWLQPLSSVFHRGERRR